MFTARLRGMVIECMPALELIRSEDTPDYGGVSRNR
jgi:hypothetical protein